MSRSIGWRCGVVAATLAASASGLALPPAEQVRFASLDLREILAR